MIRALLTSPRLRGYLFPASRFWRSAPALAWAVLIFILSSIPGDSYPEVRIFQFDKLVHFLLYLPLGVGLARMAGPPPAATRSAARSVAVPVVLGSLYGASDELHQLLVPNRSCTLADFVVDILAVTAGAFLWRFMERLAGQEEPVLQLSASRESA